MSVDTRTPRTPTGGGSSGFDTGLDDAPALSMVKVPSDPAQIIVNHASFRVQLGASARHTAQSQRITRHLSAAEETARIAAVGATAVRAGAAPAAGRRRPVVWSGKSDPDDTGAHRLLQAVRGGSVGHTERPAVDAGATQVIPRIDVDHGYRADYDDELAQTTQTPVIGAQRTPGGDGARLLPHMRTVGSAYDEPAHEGEHFDDGFDETRADRAARRQNDEAARHAYYPGRRMNLGVVLLPLRIFLGFITIYAGMGKLCDPVYFDGGKRGSMVKWLNTLHPWEVAEPLRQFALQHPVGAGLVIAFFQVIVGVLTILGCWQRVAAVVGAGLSAALLVTVSWKSVPVYDTPDIIYLAAWSPLIIAGAPVYSIDGRLAGGAWRRLGPHSDIWELRSYVLRRGALVTAIVTGLTLLIGSVLGGAVRDADRVIVPGPGEAPRNELPGSPLPQDSAKAHKKKPSASTAPSHSATSGPSTDPSAAPGATHDTGATIGGSPSQTQGTTGQTSPRQSSPAQQAPSTTSGPTGGTSTSGGSTGGSGTGGSSSGEPGLVGGLLG
ncbi:DoxX family membrane protein [Streptomyces sp. NPDC005303]|uniref:DoxX family protein n=1 Tax=Streptomyces sp. NPDC005303 TaxID=3155713 RepID=UPI0033B037D5